LGVFAAIFLLAAVPDPSRRVAAEALRPGTGGAKPDFRLLELGTGNRRGPADFRGDIVLVHFWATWCEPCRAELVALQRFAARAQGQPIAILTIAVGEVEQRVRRFTEGLGVTLPILLDPDRGVAKSWQVYALPTSYVLGADRRVRLFVEQDYDWDSLAPADLVARARAARGAARLHGITANEPKGGPS